MLCSKKTLNYSFILSVTTKGLRKVNKLILIQPVNVVKLLLTFLSLLCWSTPPHNCSIVCIDISVIPVDQLKGYWVWDPTLCGIIYGQGHWNTKTSSWALNLHPKRSISLVYKVFRAFKSLIFALQKTDAPTFFLYYPLNSLISLLSFQYKPV